MTYLQKLTFNLANIINHKSTINLNHHFCRLKPPFFIGHRQVELLLPSGRVRTISHTGAGLNGLNVPPCSRAVADPKQPGQLQLEAMAGKSGNLVGGLEHAFYGNLWESMGIYGKLWESMGIYGNLWESMGIYGNLWESMGKYGNLWESMGNYGKLWETMGIYGNLWESMGIYGTLWESMGNYGKLWESMGICFVGLQWE